MGSVNVIFHVDVSLCLVYILWVVLNDAFCMTLSLLMLVEDARDGHMEEVSFCSPHPMAVSTVYTRVIVDFLSPKYSFILGGGRLLLEVHFLPYKIFPL